MFHLHPHPLWYNAPNLTLSIRDSDEFNHTQNIPVSTHFSSDVYMYEERVIPSV